MKDDRQLNIDLEIEYQITQLQEILQRNLTQEERWIYRYAFLSGDSYGLKEASILIKS